MRRGGSAGDAAVAMAAVLQVVSPIGSGVGGDCFGIFYDASTGTIRCLDGSGRSPAALTKEHLISAETDGFIKADSRGLLATVPGAVKAWFETVEHFGSGKLSMSEILEPAVRFAKEGFPLSLPGALLWERAKPKLLRMHGGRAYLIDGETVPSPGDILNNVPMAGLLKRIADEGPSALYTGPVAQNIVEAVAEVGGLMTLDDLRKHLESSEPTVLPAISTTYRGTTVHTTPLPSQGAILLDALNILELFDLEPTKSNPAKYYHLVIEAMRLASEDGLLHVADPQFSNIDQLIRKEHGEKRKELLDVERFVPRCSKDLPNGKQGGTTFMAAVDPWGNACSFITSIAHPFGCTTVPEYGFGVHARGDGFNTMLEHPNCAAPCKKPFHSLMPVLVTDSSSGKLLSLVGTVGGSAQPQAILQVLLNMVEHGLNPQEAIDKPRLRIGWSRTFHPDDPLTVEDDVDAELIEGLKERGHAFKQVVSGIDRSDMGHVHVISRGRWWDPERCGSDGQGTEDGVLWCGADQRCGGVAMAY
ncbi:glutathione hydrolase-like YwrD proenzyme [Ixodes scapularis]